MRHAPTMTKLLVSVRNAREAQIALDGGADLIDVKEPRRGSLGAADADTIIRVVKRVNGRVRVSAALGELGSALRLPATLAGHLHYAKVGLAGCQANPVWPDRWQQALKSLPTGVAGVAVAYADWQAARAPDIEQVFARAREFGCPGVLVDTFDKSRGGLLQHASVAVLQEFIAAVQSSGMFAVVAGSLDFDQIRQVLPLGPDFVAVRGAVCVANRTGRLDASRVRRLASLVHDNLAESRHARCL